MTRLEVNPILDFVTRRPQPENPTGFLGRMYEQANAELGRKTPAQQIAIKAQSEIVRREEERRKSA
jgi:hypothetical protein